MRANLGNIDRILRLAAAVIIGAFYFTDHLRGAMGVWFLLLAGLFALTGLLSVCPIYSLLGFSTRRTDRQVK